eukprot:152216_1
MSSRSDTTDLAKLRKTKKCYCLIVAGCMWVGLILTAISYGSFRDSKFYDAPTDQCMFTYASPTLFDCRYEETCDGLQTRFYYNTTEGTCASNELYAHSVCDCDDNPPPIPKSDHGLDTPDTCWILDCESGENWTFTDQKNERTEGWLFGIVGVGFTLVGLFYCCNCIQTGLRGGAGMIEELGEKETYDRFHKTVQDKATEHIPKEWKVLHISVVLSSIAVPIILIGAFLIATFSWGGNLTDNTISEGIQYRRGQKGVFTFIQWMTMLACALASYVSWCRQIQIEVYFRYYAMFFGAKEAKKYRWLNVMGMVFNVVGYLGIGELVAYDANRYGGEDPLHGLWAMVAFLSTGAFLLIATVITIKQRQIEYRRNMIVKEQTPWVALRNTFWYDAFLMLLLFIAGSVSLFAFFGEIAKASKIRNEIPEDERLNTFAYIHVFTAEWSAFFSFVSGIAVVALSFQHDHIAWEMHDYFKTEVVLWPCAGCIFKCLGSCCGCCCNLSPLGEMVVELEAQLEQEGKAVGTVKPQTAPAPENKDNRFDGLENASKTESVVNVVKDTIHKESTEAINTKETFLHLDGEFKTPSMVNVTGDTGSAPVIVNDDNTSAALEEFFGVNVTGDTGNAKNTSVINKDNTFAALENPFNTQSMVNVTGDTANTEITQVIDNKDTFAALDDPFNTQSMVNVIGDAVNTDDTEAIVNRDNTFAALDNPFNTESMRNVTHVKETELAMNPKGDDFETSV